MARLSTNSEPGGPELAGRLGRNFTALIALQACHLAEMTGTLRATSRGRWIRVALAEGEVVAADSSQAHGLDALTAFASWTEGDFTFLSGAPAGGTRVRGAFNWLLLELCRRLDERAAAGGAVPAGPS
jgi:hypothetical protein